MLRLYAKRHECIPPTNYPGVIGIGEMRSHALTRSARALLRARRGGTYPFENVHRTGPQTQIGQSCLPIQRLRPSSYLCVLTSRLAEVKAWLARLLDDARCSHAGPPTPRAAYPFLTCCTSESIRRKYMYVYCISKPSNVTPRLVAPLNPA